MTEPDFGVTAYRVGYEAEDDTWVARPSEGPHADYYQCFIGCGESAQSALAFLREAMHVAPDPTVGTPEYEPTDPSPVRLSGGAN